MLIFHPLVVWRHHCSCNHLKTRRDREAAGFMLIAQAPATLTLNFQEFHENGCQVTSGPAHAVPNPKLVNSLHKPSPARIRSYSSSPSRAETPINPPLSEAECAINALPQRTRNSLGGLVPKGQAWPGRVAFGDVEWRVCTDALHAARLVDGCGWRACVGAAQ